MSRSHPIRLLTACLSASAIGLTGCTGPQATPTLDTLAPVSVTAPRREADGVLHIGVFLPRTGEGAQLGEPMVTAIEDAIATINDAGGVLGAPVKLSLADESLGTGPGDLLDAGVDAIIGPASSRTALSQLSTAVRANSGVVVCSPSATAIALDGFPDNGYLFRTAPSDSLQMTAIARLARQTGVSQLNVAYLDDPYGRALAKRLTSEATRTNLTVANSIAFSPDTEDLSSAAQQLADAPGGVVVVLADADDGGRLLTALDRATTQGSAITKVFLNDSVRGARNAIKELSSPLRDALVGVAPSPVGGGADPTLSPFVVHATDCANLIAIAAVVAESDAPDQMRTVIPAVSSDGRECGSFAACAKEHELGLDPDYDGMSGPLSLRVSSGDPRRAWFERFRFTSDGSEEILGRFLVDDNQ